MYKTSTNYTKIERIYLPFSLGVVGGVNTINSNAYIPLFPSNDDCGAFTKGLGNGQFAGIDLGLEFVNSNLVANLRVFNEKRPATLEEKSSCFEVLSPIDDKYYPLLRNHTYLADFSFLAVDIGLKFRLVRFLDEKFDLGYVAKFPLYIRGAYESGQAIFKKTYNNTEVITSPDGVSFPNTNTTKNIVESGEFQETVSSEALNLSIGAEFNIYKDLWLAPEFTYRYELSQAIEKYNWDMNILRFGVNLFVAFNRNEPIKKKEIEKDSVDSSKVIVEAKDGKKVYNNLGGFVFNEIDFTETVVTQTFPILPYIFFDSTSAKLRNVYNIDKNNFDEKALNNSTIDIYYNVINIIAHRMKKFPNSTIKLVGNTDGVELATSQEKLDLAKQRAMELSKVFQSYGIDGKRLIIEVRETPKLPTSDKYIEGLQENRRVDIETSNLELMEPVMHSDFLEYTPNKKLFFMSQLKNTEEIQEMKFDLSNANNTIYSERISKPDQKIVYHNVKEKILEQVSKLIDSGISEVEANIQLSYSDGEVENKSFKIPIKKEKSAFEVGRLNLIVFDFDKSTISESNKSMIKDFISNSIYSDSKTTITGSTDLLGEKQYNKTLSFDRATEVANYIKQINPKYTINEIKGLGSENILFDNSTPEGRFYCRTVLVEVKTPIKEAK